MSEKIVTMQFNGYKVIILLVVSIIGIASVSNAFAINEKILVSENTVFDFGNFGEFDNSRDLVVIGERGFLTWTEDFATDKLFFSKSIDGSSWSTPLELTDNRSAGSTVTNRVFLTDGAGNIHIFYQVILAGTPRIYEQFSSDFGDTWDTAGGISFPSEGWSVAINGDTKVVANRQSQDGAGDMAGDVFVYVSPDSTNAFFPRIKLVNSGLPNADPDLTTATNFGIGISEDEQNIVVVFNAETFFETQTDLYETHSTDNGETFSAPTRISQEVTEENEGRNIIKVYFSGVHVLVLFDTDGDGKLSQVKSSDNGVTWGSQEDFNLPLNCVFISGVKNIVQDQFDKFNIHLMCGGREGIDPQTLLPDIEMQHIFTDNFGDNWQGLSDILDVGRELSTTNYGIAVYGDNLFFTFQNVLDGKQFIVNSTDGGDTFNGEQILHDPDPSSNSNMHIEMSGDAVYLAGEISNEVFAWFSSGLPQFELPEITLIGDSFILLEFDGIYNELGATCLDDVDGQIDGNVIIGGDTVNTSVQDIYTVTYDCSNSLSYNAVPIIRTIKIAPELLPPSAIQTTELYTCDKGGSKEIHEIDQSDGTIISSNAVSVSGFTYNGCKNMATDPTDGQMYMIAELDLGRALVTIDPTTGVGDFVTYFADSSMNDIVFDIVGNMYGGISTDDDGYPFFSLDPSDGTIIQLCTFSDDYNFHTLNYDDGIMYKIDDEFNLTPIDIGEANCGEANDLYMSEFDTVRDSSTFHDWAYDSKTNRFFMQTDSSDPQIIYTFDVNNIVATNISGELNDGSQRGMAFALTIEPPLVSGITTTDLYTCDKKTESGNNEIHKISEFDGTIISSNTFTVTGSGFVNPISGCFAMATDPTDGQMYAVMEDNTDDRFVTQIDPTTGVGTAIAQFTKSGSDFKPNDISFDISGQMFTHTGSLSRSLFEVDKTTGIVEPVAECVYVGSSLNPSTLNYDDSFMYHITGGGVTIDHFIGKVDITETDCIVSESLMNTIEFEPVGVFPQAPSQAFDMTYSTTQGLFLHRSHDDVNSSIPQTLLTVEIDGTTVIIATQTPNVSQRGLAFALSLDVPTSTSTTTDDLYSCDNPNEGGNLIHLIDETDGSFISSQTIVVSGLNQDGCLGLATDPTNGQMYAILRDSDRYLVSIDPTTGVGTNIGQFTYIVGGFDFYARSINFDIDGQLYVTESTTNEDPDDYWKADKTTGIVDTENLLCNFNTNGSTPFMTLNYDTGKMWYIDAGSASGSFIGEIDTTFAGGSCKLTNIETDRGTESSFGQGLAYDTVTGDLFFLDNYNQAHDFLQITLAGTHTEIGILGDGSIQKGLSFSITLGSGSFPDPINADLNNPDHLYLLDGDATDEKGGNSLVLSDGEIGLNSTGWSYLAGDRADLINSINDTQYAIEIVFTPTQTVDFNRILDWHNFGGSVVNDQTNYGLYLENNGFNFHNLEDVESVYSPNEELHILVQRNNTGFVELWLDGVLVLVQNDSQEEFTFNDDNTSANNDQRIIFFKDNTDEHFDGYVECIAIYDGFMNFTSASTVTSVDGQCYAVPEQVDSPLILLNGISPLNIPFGSVYNELGAICVDDEDGNITANIVQGGDTVDTNIVAQYIITFDCQDSNQNDATQIKRVVNVNDLTNPIITITGDVFTSVFVNDPYVELGATCVDDFDGQIDGNVVTSGDIVNTAVVGTYVIDFDCADSSNNDADQKSRTVTVSASIGLNILGSSPFYVEFNTPFVDQGSTCIDAEDGGISVVVGGDIVDTQTAGTYKVTYDCTDSESNIFPKQIRYVNVLEDQDDGDLVPFRLSDRGSQWLTKEAYNESPQDIPVGDSDKVTTMHDGDTDNATFMYYVSQGDFNLPPFGADGTFPDGHESLEITKRIDRIPIHNTLIAGENDGSDDLFFPATTFIKNDLGTDDIYISWLEGDISAGTFFQKIRHSSDEGESWGSTNTITQLFNFTNFDYTQTVLVANDGLLHFIYNELDGTKSFYENLIYTRSSNDGASWNPTTISSGNSVIDDPHLGERHLTANGNNVYALITGIDVATGLEAVWVQVSNDGGSSWLGSPFALSDPTTYEVSDTNSWIYASGSQVVAVYFDIDNDIWYASSSSDKGESWTKDIVIDNTDCPNSYGYVSGSGHDMFLVCTDGNADDLFVIPSPDGGVTWDSSVQIIFDAGDLTGYNNIQVRTENNKSVIAIKKPTTIIRLAVSEDTGKSWTNMNVENSHSDSPYDDNDHLFIHSSGKNWYLESWENDDDPFSYKLAVAFDWQHTEYLPPIVFGSKVVIASSPSTSNNQEVKEQKATMGDSVIGENNILGVLFPREVAGSGNAFNLDTRTQPIVFAGVETLLEDEVGVFFTDGWLFKDNDKPSDRVWSYLEAFMNGVGDADYNTYVVTSLNDGNTWGSPIQITNETTSVFYGYHQSGDIINFLLRSSHDSDGAGAGCRTLFNNGELLPLGDPLCNAVWMVRSTDAGATWSYIEMDDGIWESDILMKGDGANVNIYLGDGDYHYFITRSTDTGATWSAIVPLENLNPEEFDMDTPIEVFHQGDDVIAFIEIMNINEDYRYGILRSTDSGDTWTTEPEIFLWQGSSICSSFGAYSDWENSFGTSNKENDDARFIQNGDDIWYFCHDDDRVYQRHSGDFGATWDEFVQVLESGGNNNETPVAIKQIGSNIYMAWLVFDGVYHYEFIASTGNGASGTWTVPTVTETDTFGFKDPRIETSGDIVSIIAYDQIVSGFPNQVEQIIVFQSTVEQDQPPTITLLGNAIVNVPQFSFYIDAGATCNDFTEGDISDKIITDNPVNTFFVDTFEVTYDCQDSATNNAEQVTRIVNVLDQEIPVITIIGDVIVELQLGDVYVELGAVAQDLVDGDISGDIVQGGDVVDVNTVNAYLVTFDVQDQNGNDAVQKIRTVLVTSISVASGGGSGTGTIGGQDVSGLPPTPPEFDIDDLEQSQIQDLLDLLAPSLNSTFIEQIIQTFFEFQVLDKTHDNITVNSFLQNEQLGIRWSNGDDIVITEVLVSPSPFTFTFETLPVIKVGSDIAISESAIAYNLSVPTQKCPENNFSFDCVSDIRYSIPVTVNAVIQSVQVSAEGTIIVDLSEEDIDPILLILFFTILIPIVAGIIWKLKGGHNPSNVKELLH